MADESDNISYPSRMTNVVRNNLVQRVRIRCRVTNKTFVIADMVPPKLHF